MPDPAAFLHFPRNSTNTEDSTLHSLHTFIKSSVKFQDQAPVTYQQLLINTYQCVTPEPSFSSHNLSETVCSLSRQIKQRTRGDRLHAVVIQNRVMYKIGDAIALCLFARLRIMGCFSQ